MNLFSKKSNIFIFILLFVGYLILNIWISGFYNTIPLIIVYANTVNWFKLGLSLLLTLVIGILVSLNGVLVYMKYQERKKCKEGVALASAGGIGGLAVGVCPLCVTGIFPLLLGFFGISFSFANLPFEGIEIQLLTIIILFASLVILNKRL
ncbi:MAG: hypothetical protein AABX16_02805 [Nanoarchaeota archaeon]